MFCVVITAYAEDNVGEASSNAEKCNGVFEIVSSPELTVDSKCNIYTYILSASLLP